MAPSKNQTMSSWKQAAKLFFCVGTPDGEPSTTIKSPGTRNGKDAVLSNSRIRKPIDRSDLTRRIKTQEQRDGKEGNSSVPESKIFSSSNELISNTQFAGESHKFPFMSLPVEIRLQIYDLLLVSRLPGSPCGIPDAVRNTNQMKISLDKFHRLWVETMTAGIVRTCREVYNEANPILYSQNVFQIIEPERVLQYITQIGHSNLKSLRYLNFSVKWDSKLSSWLELLHTLAEEASGLRKIEIEFGINWDFPFMIWPVREDFKGYGVSREFMHALGTIQGLENLTVSGFWDASWPEYLQTKMGCQVEAIVGRSQDGLEDGLNEWQLGALRACNKRYSVAFCYYQGGVKVLSSSAAYDGQ
ncbi:hypothetical protein GLAREA_08369 [Glarea lozoyensis ATCC 20868]|uniref:DUF7730 domain-containing protein n=1 Tax=Glarea lozoyensis (strain ATCC 20868 / MF5171) TaxID=1116229 RepID=S3CDA5_GLAL2|nr:uncharacterized protein GLAREA_08369 [Glarea lozoyensis ATCC 20868]EPE24517.1 hypothetical protein GLAREA_08369 [Glarea lozoyensis ATCC 20868]